LNGPLLNLLFFIYLFNIYAIEYRLGLGNDKQHVRIGRQWLVRNWALGSALPCFVQNSRNWASGPQLLPKWSNKGYSQNHNGLSTFIFIIINPKQQFFFCLITFKYILCLIIYYFSILSKNIIYFILLFKYLLANLSFSMDLNYSYWNRILFISSEIEIIILWPMLDFIGLIVYM
jgi:hypothetical protein